MAERALAHIEKVEWVNPIEGADNIELIGILGWVCVAKRRSLGREILLFTLRLIVNVRKMMSDLLFGS